jgi:hypothetical protein
VRWAAADGAAPCVLSERDWEALAYFHGDIAALHRAHSRCSWTRRTCACVWPGRAAWGSAVPLLGTCAAPRVAPASGREQRVPFPAVPSGDGEQPEGSGEKTEEIVGTWVDDGVLPVRGRGAKRGAERGAGIAANCAQLLETE